MTKFKENDVVRCVRFDGISNIKDDETYKVLKCTNTFVTLAIANLYDGRSYGEPNTFSVDRFELAEGSATHIPEKRVVYYEEYDDEESEEHEMTACEKALRYEIAVSLLERAYEALDNSHQYELAAEIADFLEE